MKKEEHQQLLDLFESPQKWCQGSEARNAQGEAVPFDDPTAVCWDLVGGLCHLFGWPRACALFGQIHKHVLDPSLPTKPIKDLDAMRGLLDYNDAGATTYEQVVSTLREMPVWREREEVS